MKFCEAVHVPGRIPELSKDSANLPWPQNVPVMLLVSSKNVLVSAEYPVRVRRIFLRYGNSFFVSIYLTCPDYPDEARKMLNMLGLK